MSIQWDALSYKSYVLDYDANILSLWRRAIEMLSILLVIFKDNPIVPGGGLIRHSPSSTTATDAFRGDSSHTPK